MTGTDILTGTDFLKQKVVPEGVSVIVTNPPYKLISEFLRQCIKFDLPFALLLPWYAIEGKERHEIISSAKDVVVLLPDKRIHYDNPTDGNLKSSFFVSCWVCSQLQIPDTSIRVKFVELQPGIVAKAG